ncbi:50S ribosomal protein L11 [Candidatus Woesearchaeota archaeon]|nr:50S ribosomal protein L11 [Candidatus Woesearchaeota archaeon]
MSKIEKIDMITEGGKAAPTPAIAQKLGPLKINIGQVMSKVNDKTKAFSGMKVPVKLLIDVDTKEVNVEVGTPSTSELLKKELKLEKGSPARNKEKVTNAPIESIIKVARMKYDSMLVNDLKGAVNQVIGSCNSLGILVESLEPKDAVAEVNKGNYDKEIKEEKIEPSPEKLSKLKSELEKVQARLKEEQEKLKALEAAKEAAKPAAAPAEGEAKATEADKEATKPAAKPTKEERKK